MLLRGPLKRVLNSRKTSNSVLIGGGTTAAGGGIRKVAQQVLQSTFTSSSRAFSSLMQSSLRRIAILSWSSGSILTSAAWFSWASDNERRSVSTTAAPPAETPAATSDTKLRVETGAAQIAHPSKRAKGGEDAFFISKDGRAMGVFDGVGGWTESGVDPRIYAVKLAEGSEAAAASADLNTVSPTQIMDGGYRNAFNTLGSATACVAVIRDDGTLHTANVGDSGYMLIRDSKLFFKSTEQQHGFNFPYQLGCRGHPADTPQSAQTLQHSVKSGDVLVLATDGFFDNVFPEDVVSIVNSEVSKISLTHPTLPSTLATALAQKAFALSQSNKNGPFAVNARKAGFRFDGGKPDDITVVVGVVSPSEGPQAKL